MLPSEPDDDEHTDVVAQAAPPGSISTMVSTLHNLPAPLGITIVTGEALETYI
jgi:hypothetical protein